MPPWMRWMVLVVVVALGWAGQARAQAPQPLELAAHYDRAPAAFHGGQATGAALAGTGLAAIAVGAWGISQMGDQSTAMGGLGVAAGGVLGGIGAIGALGAASSLDRHGYRIDKTAGWVGAGALGFGLAAGAVGLLTLQPGLIVAGILAAPVAVIATSIQLGVNAASARRGPTVSLAASPIPEGAVAGVHVRF